MMNVTDPGFPVYFGRIDREGVFHNTFKYIKIYGIGIRMRR